MADTVILRGFTATAPQLRTLPTGIPVVNFRLASTPRWFDSATNSWREGQTSWYTVCAYRKLAQNIAASLTVGSPILLTGRVRTQQWQREDGSQGASVEVDASSIGLDLTFGTSTFSRTVEHSGTQSHTQDDTTNPIQKDVSQDGHAAPQQPSSTQQYPNRALQKAGPRGTASSPQRELSQPKTLFQHLQIRTRLFNNLQNLQIVLSMRNKAIKYLKWHPSRIQHHNFEKPHIACRVSP